MERLPENTIERPPLELTNLSVQYLLQTAKWARFMAIAGFVGIGMLILFGFALLFGFSFLEEMEPVGRQVYPLCIIYWIMAILYFFPVFYLYRFADRTKEGIFEGDILWMESGFGNLKSMFKFMGVLTIVVISMYVLGLVLLIIASLVAGSLG